MKPEITPISLDCRLDQEQLLTKWTVGDRIHLLCQGDVKDLGSQVSLVVPTPEQKYQLQLLELSKKSDHEIQMTVTSYVPGDHKFEKLKLVSGETEYFMSPLPLKVESVIDPQQKEPKPYASVGPFSLLFPWVEFFILLALIIFLLGALLVRLRRWWQRKKLIEQIDQMQSRLPPVTELSSQYRKIKKLPEEEKIKSASELNQQFFLYVTREFLIPAQQWSPQTVLKDFKKRYRAIYDLHENEMKKIFRELTLLSANTTPAEKDVNQMIEMTLALAEKLTLTKQKQKEKS